MVKSGFKIMDDALAKNGGDDGETKIAESSSDEIDDYRAVEGNFIRKIERKMNPFKCASDRDRDEEGDGKKDQEVNKARELSEPIADFKVEK